MWNSERFPRVNLSPKNPPLRQQRQHGVFTRLSHAVFCELESYLNNQVIGGGARVCLYCLEIAPAAIPAIQAMLAAEGLNDEVLGIGDAFVGETWMEEVAHRCNELLPAGPNL
jgi:hypothetical protein